MMSYGTPNATGAVFGVIGEYQEGKLKLSFWGHYADYKTLAEISDNDWHFVAISYDGRKMRLYMDGENKGEKALSLNTSSGPMILAGRNGHPTYLKGSIRDISVWNHARTQGQIQSDMVPWPKLTGREGGLVAHFPLNEGSGNTFSNLKRNITGTVNRGATWSKPIAKNPNPTDEGIWFVIQNKADLDNDTGKSARRMAMSMKDNRIKWEPIPLSGDYDKFLWKIVLKNGRNYLINKKSGDAKAMDTYSGKRYTFMQNIGNYSGQHWTLQQADVEHWGTNAYTLWNDFVTSAEALTLTNNDVYFSTKKTGSTSQVWMLHPMQLENGYHIPVSAAANSPMTQELLLDYDIKVYATNTTTDWAVLNGHIIWKNMLNALYDQSTINRLKSRSFTRKDLQIITRFDKSSFVAKYPLNTSHGSIIFDEDWFTKYRGGSGNDPRRQLSSTTVSQEMMCRKGVFSRGYEDNAVREFDQTVHEFAHALDKVGGMDGGRFPDPTLYGSRTEAIAAAIQAWFNNNNSYDIFPRTRAEQKTQQSAHYNRLKTFFREDNTWMPPRWLRNQPTGRVELNNGEKISYGEWIYTTTPYGSDGTYGVLQKDGNFVIYTNDNQTFKWGTFNNLRVPLNKVTTITMDNGILRMKDARGNVIYSSNNSPARDARLVLGSPLPGKPNSWIRIINSSKQVLWTP